MTMNPPKESLLDRFKRYVQIDTKSEEDSEMFPSTECQWDLLRLLEKELADLGVADAAIDEHGYVFGTVPSNLPDEQSDGIPVIGFIAHADTSPAVSGTGVKPTVHPTDQGGDIALPGDPSQVIHASE